jgi:hypothetical protein
MKGLLMGDGNKVDKLKIDTTHSRNKKINSSATNGMT